MKKCPKCGAELPDSAAFCPHCASDLNQRQEIRPPRTRLRRGLRAVAAVVLLLAAAAGLAWHFRPQTVEGRGEVLYTDREGTYQLVLGWPSDHFTGVPEIDQSGEPDGDYRFPVRMYINHVESGADAGPLFRRKVESCTATITQPEDAASPMTCTVPEPMDFDPEAAYITLVDLKGDSGSGELELKLQMTNGDTVLLHQTIIMEAIETENFYPEDHPMDTVAQLEELLAEIDRTVPEDVVVNLYLPPVTYTEPWELTGHPVNLIGSMEGEERTTFTRTVEVHSGSGALPYIQNINFVGQCDGVGLSCSRSLHVIDCTFATWKTGLLAYGYAWVNVQLSRFVDNQVGFHFNSGGDSVTHTLYNGNQFEHNGTAVLLEQVPTDTEISFPECVFVGNEIDIDNLCGQEIDTSQARFQ